MSTSKPRLIIGDPSLHNADTLTITPVNGNVTKTPKEEIRGIPLKNDRYIIIPGKEADTVIDTLTGNGSNNALRLSYIPLLNAEIIPYKKHIEIANWLYNKAPKAPSTSAAFYSALNACKDVGSSILSIPSFPYSTKDKLVVIKNIDAIIRALVKFMRGKTREHKQDIFKVMDDLLYLRQYATGPVEGNDGRTADLQKIQTQLYDRPKRNNTHSNHNGGRRRRTQKRKN